MITSAEQNLVTCALWIAKHLARARWLTRLIVPSVCREEFFKAVHKVEREQREFEEAMQRLVQPCVKRV
jgi:hypothetical protein